MITTSITQFKKDTSYTDKVANETIFISGRDVECVAIPPSKYIELKIEQAIYKTISLNEFRKQSIHSKQAHHKIFYVKSRKGDFFLVPLSIYKDCKPKSQEDAIPNETPSIKKPKKAKIAKVVTPLSVRIKRAIAWDGYAFCEADGMWTDIREEVEKLESRINSLETEQGDGNENKAD